MTLLRGPIPAPAWYHTGRRPTVRGRLGRKRVELVNLLQCSCGFTYVAPARKPLPARCLYCHHASMGRPWGWRTLRKTGPLARRAA